MPYPQLTKSVQIQTWGLKQDIQEYDVEPYGKTSFENRMIVLRAHVQRSRDYYLKMKTRWALTEEKQAQWDAFIERFEWLLQNDPGGRFNPYHHPEWIAAAIELYDIARGKRR